MEEQLDVAGRRKLIMSLTKQSDSSSLFPQIDYILSIECLLRCSRSDYGSIAQLNKSFRSLFRSGKIYKLRREMEIVEHWVYFSCNPFEWMCFDPVGLGWMHLPKLFLANSKMYCNGTLAVGAELLVFGTESGSRLIYKFSILTNSWSLGREMNEPRCSFGSASLGDIAIVAGGFDAKGNILRSAEIYNSDKGTWESLPIMMRPRMMCSGVFMDGNFYVVGGIGVGNPSVLTCGEMYDLKTKRWCEIPDMFPRRHTAYEAPPLLAVVRNELYAAFCSENEVRKYDKVRKQWSTVGNLPERGVSMNSRDLAFSAYGDRLIVICVEPRDSDGLQFKKKKKKRDSDGQSFGGIGVHDCVPDERRLLQWSQLTYNYEPGLARNVYNSTVMGC